MGHPNTTHHDRMIELLLRGWSYAAIGRDLGMGRSAARRIALLPDVQTEVERLRRERREAAQRKLDNATDRALKALVRNLECGDPHAEVRAAKEILDRAGVVPTQRIEIATNDRDPVERLRSILGLADPQGDQEPA